MMKIEAIRVSLTEEDEAAVAATAGLIEVTVAEYLARAIAHATALDVPRFERRSYCEVNDVDGRLVTWSHEIHARAAHMAQTRKPTERAYQGPNRDIAPGMVMQYGDATEPVGSDIGNMTILVLDVGRRNGLPIAQVCPVYRAWDDAAETLSEPRVTLSDGSRYAAMIADVRHVNCDAVSFPHGIVRHERIDGDDLAKARGALAEAIRRIELAAALADGTSAHIDVSLSQATAHVQLDPDATSRYRAAISALGISHDAYWTMSVRRALRDDSPRLRVYGPDLGPLGDLEVVREDGESDDEFALRQALEDVLKDAIDRQTHEDAVDRAKRVYN